MKSLVYIIISISFTYGCNVNHRQNQDGAEVRSEKRIIADTIVSAVTRPGDAGKEYFLMINGDTSRFSLFVASNSKSDVVANYGLGSDRKFSDYAGDSNAITAEPAPLKRTAVNGYTQQLMELSLLFEAAAKDFNLKKLAYVRFKMSDIYGFSTHVTERFIAGYGERFHLKSYQNISNVIRQSGFVTEVNRILLPGKLVIDKISIDGLAYYKSIKDTKKSLNGMVIFGIKAIE